MRIRILLHPTIITATMFLVLGIMLALNQRIPGEPAYRDINQCLIDNIERQQIYNKELLEELTDPPLECMKGRDSVDYKLLHTNVQNAIFKLKDAHIQVISGDTSKILQERVKHIVAQIDSIMLTPVSPYVKEGMSKFMMTNKMIMEKAFVNFRRISRDNRITLLYAIQNNVLLSEQYMLRQIEAQNSNCGCGFDLFQAISVADRSWAHKGEKINAVIMLAAYNKAIDPVIMPDKGKIEKIENGIGYWTGSSKLGKHSISGTASITQHDMLNAEYTVTSPWSFEYLVLAPGASVSIDKMHQLYAGIANPITISAPGYDAVNVSLRVPGADVVKLADGRYEVKTDNARKLMAYLDATNEKGETATLEGMQLNIVPLPPPVVRLNNDTACCLSVAAFNNTSQLTAHAADEDTDMHYTVESFEYTLLQYSRKTATEPESVTGDLLIPFNVSPGDRLVISNIVCRDENGQQVYPQSISYLLR